MTSKKAANSHEKHEKSQENEGLTFGRVCRSFRAFLCLFVAIPRMGFTVWGELPRDRYYQAKTSLQNRGIPRQAA
jgi:hypothetical protein